MYSTAGGRRVMSQKQNKSTTIKAATLAKECNHTIFTDSAGIYCKKCKKRNRDLYITDH